MLPSLARLGISNLDTEAKRKRDDEDGDAPPPMEFLDGLPDDVKIQVLFAVERDDCTALNGICKVNKSFRDICADDAFWKSLVRSRGWIRRPQFLERDPRISYRKLYYYVCSKRRLQMESDDNEYFFITLALHILLRMKFSQTQQELVEAVRILVAAGADVDLSKNLQRASAKGYVEVVRILLEAGANVHGYFDGALHQASLKGHAEVVRILLEAGADVNARLPKDGMTPLLEAVQRGHLDVVKILIEKGADVHAEEAEGYGARKLLDLYSNLYPWHPDYNPSGEYDEIAIILEDLGVAYPESESEEYLSEWDE